MIDYTGEFTDHSLNIGSMLNDPEKVVTISQVSAMMSKGDLIMASYISQIIYWHLPSKKSNATTKLRIKHKNELWLVKSDKDWYSECFIKARVIGKLKKELKSIGMINFCTAKYKGNPVTHYQITPLFQKVMIQCAEYINDCDYPKTEEDMEEAQKELNLYKYKEIKKRKYVRKIKCS